MRTLRFGLVATIILSAWILGEAAGRPPEVPPISLRLTDGTIVRPTDYRGRVLVIDFWASWCIPCRSSFPALDELYQAEHARGLEVLAINVDEDQKQAAAFLVDHPHVMPVALDPKGEAPRAFKLKGMPTSFIVDRRGMIRFTHLGYSAKVLDNYRTEISQLLAEAP